MARIWKQEQTLEDLAKYHLNTTVSHVGIEFTEIGDDFIRGRVPVDARTRQPYGILHGGVSVLLAETLGSNGAMLAIEKGFRAVGLEINANHIRSVSEGWVSGIAKPLHIGRTTHVWQIDLSNDAGQLTCVSRISMAILAPNR
jgi:1,4-dihydroxy-2-naphthoyl-CoA hydrolase